MYPTDNSTPTPAPAPNLPPETTPPKKSRWPFSRKVTIVLGVVLFIVVAGIIALVVGQKKPASNEAAGGDSIRYNRPGYEAEGTGIGDPAALVAEKTSKVVQYEGQNMLQPCTLITIDDLQGFGLQLLQNQIASPVEVSSFDGQSNTPSPGATRSFLPGPGEGNYCQYFLKGLERVTVTAYQPPYASVAALNSQVEKYQAIPDVEGVKTYQRVRNESPDLGLYLLRDGNNAIELYLDMKDAAGKDKVLKLAAKRFKEAQSTPTPLQKFSYKSPIFTASAVSTCDSLSAAAFRSVLGSDPLPTVTEKYASAVGVIELEAKLFNYITYECQRKLPAKSVAETSYIRMVITTYETKEAATLAMEADRGGAGSTKNLQEISSAIGDESFYADLSNMDKAIELRKGRVTLQATVYTGAQDASVTPEKRIQMLTPILKDAVSGPLKEY